jgi:hypothetical protein
LDWAVHAYNATIDKMDILPWNWYLVYRWILPVYLMTPAQLDDTEVTEREIETERGSHGKSCPVEDK